MHHQLEKHYVNRVGWLRAAVLGALLPFTVSLLATLKEMVYFQYGFSIIFLMLLGAVSARAVGSSIKIGVLRICFWGKWNYSAGWSFFRGLM